MNPLAHTDGQLLILAAQGQEAAFTALYQRYAGRVFAYLLPKCHLDQEQAEDLRQQVFLQLLESKAYRTASRGECRDDLAPLVFSIAANLLKNSYRRKERQQKRESIFQQLYPMHREFTPAIDTQKLSQAMRELPQVQKICVQLKFQRGLSIDEIATALDCSPGTIKSRLHYGLKSLAKIIKHPTALKQ